MLYRTDEYTLFPAYANFSPKLYCEASDSIICFPTLTYTGTLHSC